MAAPAVFRAQMFRCGCSFEDFSHSFAATAVGVMFVRMCDLVDVSTHVNFSVHHFCWLCHGAANNMFVVEALWAQYSINL